MKVNVTIAGANYNEVPAVMLPLKGGGKARFCEVSDTTAQAADVAQGKVFYDADGNYTVGINSGSGTVTTTPYKVTIKQVPHQTISAVFTPKIIGTVDAMKRAGSASLSLEKEALVAIAYAVKVKVTAEEGWISGQASVTGTIQDGLICSDIVITASEATPLSGGIKVPAGYTPIFLSNDALYTDNSLNVPLTDKKQIAANSSLYIVDVTQQNTALNDAFNPSTENREKVGCDEICVDFSGITKSGITQLEAMFLGNENLESADLSGFGTITALYSLFGYCTNLRCVYFDTLKNAGNEKINTYHTLATCANLEYLVLDNVNVDFVLENVMDEERGLPSQTKVLVPRAALETYKEDSHWSPVADRILALEDFDIVRKDGTVSVTPKGA